MLCVFFVLIFIWLGVWQLHRYHYKKILMNNYQSRLQAAPKPFSDIKNEDIQFQSVIVKGRYLKDSVMLIQNRLYQGRLGFEVLTPFQVADSEKLLLVDRGWIEKPANQAIPKVTLDQEVLTTTGYIKLLDEHQFILGKNILYPLIHPLTMQKIDIAELSKLTHFSYYPFVLRLALSEQNGFVRDWTITAVEPERHMGYAIQWFVMAFVLMLAYLGFSCDRYVKEQK